MSDEPTRRPYLAFAWFEYHASGGWNDYVGEYVDLVTAQAAIEERSTDVGQVVSLDTGQVVADYYYGNVGKWTFSQ